MRVLIILLILIVLYLLWRRYPSKECTNIKVYKYNEGKPFTVAFLGGVHGNEPAGAVGLNKLILTGYFEKMAKSKNITIIVIPEANPCGLKSNTRFQPDIIRPDINRNFGKEEGDGIIAQTIVNTFKDADLIVDIHEGWSWHKINNESVGSTVIPTKTLLAQKIGSEIVNNLNKTITDPKKQFELLDRSPCDIKTTLRCAMSKKQKDYILIEISGQNDIQPIELRSNQVNIAVSTVFNNI
jgi:predicted deacylase